MDACHTSRLYLETATEGLVLCGVVLGAVSIEELERLQQSWDGLPDDLAIETRLTLLDATYTSLARRIRDHARALHGAPTP